MFEARAGTARWRALRRTGRRRRQIGGGRVNCMRPEVAADALGVPQRALHEATRYALERKTTRAARSPITRRWPKRPSASRPRAFWRGARGHPQHVLRLYSRNTRQHRASADAMTEILSFAVAVTVKCILILVGGVRRSPAKHKHPPERRNTSALQ